ARAFLRDILGLEHVDTGDGWLVFDVPEAELGVHPLVEEGAEPMHQLSFWCDDIEAAVDELEGAGVELLSPVEDRGYGLSTSFELPGGVPVELYEPTYDQP
ncbi:MAG: VOC family protein, partial [Halobacteriota archaeon]